MDTIAKFKTGGIALVCTAFFIAYACNPPQERGNDDTDSTEEVSSIPAEEPVQYSAPEPTELDVKLASYMATYPDAEYKYIRNRDGEMQTINDEYLSKAKSRNDDQNLEDFVTFVEENYDPKKKEIEEYNKAIEVSAEPRGGMESFYEKVSNNAKIPKDISDKGATVFVEFVVDENGNITNVEAAEGMYYSNNQENIRKINDAAVKAVESTNWKWVPAKQGGNPVKMMMEVPITFDV